VANNLIGKFQQTLLRGKDPLYKAIYNISGSRPRNVSLYKLAFTHSSARLENEIGYKKNNERLEFLGDAVLDLIVAELLFKKFPFRDEGFLTEMRSKIVNAAFLDSMSRKLGLDQLLKDVSGHQRNQRPSKNMNADVFEAFIGAFFLDHGYPKTLKFVQNRIMKVFVDFEELVNVESNFKSRLVEWSHRNNKRIAFEVADTLQQGRHKQFVVHLMVDEVVVAKGIDMNKKQAEQKAAESFLAAEEKQQSQN
jgi:ribonuclease III